MKYQPTPAQMKNSNDDIQTPSALAKAIVKYYSHSIRGRVLEPCSGDGNFFRELPCPKHEIEIKRGEDFLKGKVILNRYDWIVTNPPWSLFFDFLRMSMMVADNIIFLVPLNKVLGLKSTIRLCRENGFGIANIKCWDTPPKPWPQSGFQIGTVWFSHNYAYKLETDCDLRGEW